MMQFNPDKCEVLTVTNKRNPIEYDYNIHDQTLNKVHKSKYLGVSIDRKLNWNSHIDMISKKANSVRAFLQRNTKMCPRNIKDRCYTTYVRPIVEYASSVWDPCTSKYINKLEAVQRRAARYVFSDFRRESSPTSMMQQLGWPTLLARRSQAKAVMMYKIVNKLVDIPEAVHLTRRESSTRGHNARFHQPYTRVLAYKHSFFPSTIRIWNSLPENLTQKPSLESFRLGVTKMDIDA